MYSWSINTFILEHKRRGSRPPTTRCPYSIPFIFESLIAAYISSSILTNEESEMMAGYPIRNMPKSNFIFEILGRKCGTT